MSKETAYLEVEGKYRVPSHDPVRERLREMGIPCGGIEEQRDVYYSPPGRDFGTTDEALRVRYSGHLSGLTYKGPRLSSYGLKAREEVNVSVKEGEDIERILQRLGFVPVITVTKKRQTCEQESIEISLDDVEGLGSYVEIELKGPADDPGATIEKMKKVLGIEGEHIPLSYLELILATRSSVLSEYPSRPR